MGLVTQMPVVLLGACPVLCFSRFSYIIKLFHETFEAILGSNGIDSEHCVQLLIPANKALDAVLDGLVRNTCCKKPHEV